MKAMFEARPPIEFKRPVTNPPPKVMTGVAGYTALFEKEAPPPREPFVTHRDRKAAEREARMKAHAERQALEVEDWDPKKNAKATECVPCLVVCMSWTQPILP